MRRPARTPAPSCSTPRMDVIRGKGFAATSVDELCQAAGVTKGAFFHHFRSKEELGVAAAAHFGEMAAGDLRARRPTSALADPLAAPPRLRRLPPRDPARASCPNTPACSAPWCRRPTPPTRRSAPPASARSSATPLTLEADIAAAHGAARQARRVDPARASRCTSRRVLQGAFILAKATGGAQVAADSLGHLRRYLTLLFEPTTEREALS